MFWVLVFVSLGSAVFLVSVVSKYRAFADDMQPRLEELEEKAKALEDAAEAEKKETETARERVQEIKTKEISLNQELAILETRMKAAQEREQVLEMDMYKQEFRRSKR